MSDHQRVVEHDLHERFPYVSPNTIRILTSAFIGELERINNRNRPSRGRPPIEERKARFTGKVKKFK